MIKHDEIRPYKHICVKLNWSIIYIIPNAEEHCFVAHGLVIPLLVSGVCDGARL